VDAEHGLGSLDIKLHIQAQGQGIAAVAFRELIRRVFEENPDVQAVWVEPWPENARAHRLYARCGFAPCPRPDHLGNGPSYWELHRQNWMPPP
jgi:RimJ/RimL family protein N-acetyltransferase